MKKKIFFLTGKRGGYDAMKPLLNHIKIKKEFDVKVLVADQHLIKKFGNTFNKVKKDFNNEYIKIGSKQRSDTHIDRNISMSKILSSLSKYINLNKPDLFLVYGDRCESLIASLCCINFSIPIAHFQGGDVSGNIDERIRHSITKLADYHFVSNKLSAKRIIQMGEEKKQVYIVGDNHIDSLKKVKIENNLYYRNKYSIKNNRKHIVFLMHPQGFSRKENKLNSLMVLKLLSKLDRDVICIYPCTDIGFQGIIDSLDVFKKKKNFKIFKNINYSDFIGLVKHSKFLIGNSSSGIIESSYLKTLAINLGSRQTGRLTSTNVINCDFDENKLSKLIDLITNYQNKRFKLNKIKLYYGNGNSYKKTYQILKKILNSKKKLKNKLFINKI
jgi:UDP-hydrolysing UDP-N-acetyl-D-glucosamine 2-epimerase